MRSSGLGLVSGLARQLGGLFKVERAPGVESPPRAGDRRAKDR